MFFYKPKIAGSNFIFLASIGSIPPINLATQIVISSVNATTKPTSGSPERNHTTKKFTIDSITPQTSETLNSLNIIFK